MDATKTLQVRLPAQVEPTAEDLEMLDATFQAIVALRYQGGDTWQDVERALVTLGWSVQSHLMWVAEARRGHDIEQAVARTKDEAYDQLQHLTKLDELTGVP
jgi:hypothetical protein